jgi:hypothetical protein
LRELDLHGLKMADALHVFVEAHNSLAGSGKREGLKVIHGYGSTGQGGEIRREIRDILKRNPHAGDIVTGEESENNPGFTIIYPKKRLPAGSERLWDSILGFCSEPRLQEEIVRKFIRRSADPEIARAIRELQNRGRLIETFVNGRKKFLAKEK